MRLCIIGLMAVTCHQEKQLKKLRAPPMDISSQATGIKRYNILPVPKPRMTRSDKWKKRPCVLRYWEFIDQVRAAGVELASYDAVIFVIPMPKSWSVKKKVLMKHKPHEQKPDFDNLLKALCDAVHKDDSHLQGIPPYKVWGNTGEIIIVKNLIPSCRDLVEIVGL